LRKQKTRFIYTGHDTTILLGKVRDSLAKEEKCREDIGMLDCPFVSYYPTIIRVFNFLIHILTILNNILLISYNYLKICYFFIYTSL